MAETNAGSLTTSLIIEDRASSVLKNIARSAEQARIALDSVNIAVARANSATRFNTSGISQNFNVPPQSRAQKAEVDVLTTAATDSLKAAQVAASASVSSIFHAKKLASNIEKLSPYLSKTGQSLHLFLERMNATFSALVKRIPVIEKAARTIARITEPFVEIFQSIQKRIPLMKSTLNRLGTGLMQMGADGTRSIQRGIASIKRAAEKFSALMNAGANLAGWGQILNSIKEGVARQFARADALAMQMGRFRLIAEDEGTRGGDNIRSYGGNHSPRPCGLPCNRHSEPLLHDGAVVREPVSRPRKTAHWIRRIFAAGQWIPFRTIRQKFTVRSWDGLSPHDASVSAGGHRTKRETPANAGRFVRGKERYSGADFTGMDAVQKTLYRTYSRHAQNQSFVGKCRCGGNLPDRR